MKPSASLIPLGPKEPNHEPRSASHMSSQGGKTHFAVPPVPAKLGISNGAQSPHNRFVPPSQRQLMQHRRQMVVLRLCGVALGAEEPVAWIDRERAIASAVIGHADFAFPGTWGSTLA
jgi:hypothetical protein